MEYNSGTLGHGHGWRRRKKGEVTKIQVNRGNNDDKNKLINKKKRQYYVRGYTVKYKLWIGVGRACVCTAGHYVEKRNKKSLYVYDRLLSYFSMSVTLAAWRVRPYFQTRTIRVSATGNDVTSAHKPRPPQPDTAVHRANECYTSAAARSWVARVVDINIFPCRIYIKNRV